MNELEFKHHLKELVQGHHHPEEHDWDGQTGAAKPAKAKKVVPAKKASATRRRATRKTGRGK